MDSHRLVLAAALFLLTIAFAAPPAMAGSPIGPEGLDSLRAAVRGYVERDEVVGAEVLVMTGSGEVLLHEAFGLADREAATPLAVDRIHCIRSMTKTLVGTAVQTLIDEGRLGLDDPVARWLPAFDHGDHARITVRHLLEHTSGLPLSSLLDAQLAGKDLKEIRSLDDVVARAGAATLGAAPGERFSYSDDGVDALAALAGRVAGMPVEELLRTRVLQPAGMNDTSCGPPTDRTRAIDGYAGSAHAWTRFWSPKDPPYLGCFLGSQGAFSTARDYARLLSLWLHDGMVGERRVLSHAAVERGLAMAHRTDFPNGLVGTVAGYGQCWSVWTAGEGASARRVAFGHGGSDGTMGWCFPDRDLIVCYFSQSRGGLTPIAFEGELDRVLFGHERSARSAADLLGWWRSPDESQPVLILERDGKPTLDIPGRFSLVLRPEAAPDRWGFELDPSSSITVERDAGGAVTGLDVRSHDRRERWTRHQRPADLPTLDEVMAKVHAAHGIGAEGIPFPLERFATLDMPAAKRHVRLVQRYNGLASRVESSLIGASASAASIGISDGTHVWNATPGGEPQEVSGAQAEQSLLEHPGRLFGDLRRHGASIEVVGRTTVGTTQVVQLWCRGRLAPSMIVLVEESSGQVVGLERVVTVPGLGQVGVSSVFSDFRRITARGRTIILPFTSTGRFTNPALGVAVTKIETCATPERIDAAQFRPAVPRKGG